MVGEFAIKTARIRLQKSARTATQVLKTPKVDFYYVKIDRRQLGIHLPWGLVATFVTVALAAWYVASCLRAERWLGGGSASGLACGIAAGLVIAFEMLLWPRKHFRRLRLIPARQWMAAHLWLGLASVPLAIVHTGFNLGGTLPMVLMVLFLLTALSGIFGLILQNVIPKWTLRLLPAETIYSQIDHVAEQSLQDLRRALVATCGTRKSDGSESLDSEPALPIQTSIVVGAVREIGLVRGRILRTQSVVRHTEDRDVLWNALDEIEPFLAKGKKSKSPLSRPGEATRWFSELRRACSNNSEAVIASMEQCYVQRQQFDLQSQLHHWLHGWLPIHIGLSVAVSVLLVAHIITALKYW